MKYSVIYADPPWMYLDRHNTETRFHGGAAAHYPLMHTAEIKRLPIADMAADNCMLFLWAVFPRLPAALEVMEAWGFQYKTLGFSWIKINKWNRKPCHGIGFYTKSNCEVCLLGVKGRPLKQTDTVSSVIVAPRQEHSKKPDIVRDKIVDLCGDVPRIELFARQRVAGWDCWGNEC